MLGSKIAVSSPLAPSTTFAPPLEVGRYLMFGVIAKGGMAAVHYGMMNGPVGFRRTVAIKRLHEQFAEDPEFVSQFLDEARLAARIRHPNVVQTLDVVAEQKQLLLVMEYVDGETLGRLLVGARKARGQIPVEQAVGIVAGALHGLHAAHEATDEQGVPLHIVHRDVSPQNILVGRDGVARVLDFGVAKAAARIHSTEGAKIKGKLRYMAPEQVGGEGVDRRTDVFAAGVVLWEILAGRRLFDSKEGAGAIINQVLTREIPAPSRFRREVSPRLDQVVSKALDRDVSTRYQSALEFAIDLERASTVPSAHAMGSWVKSVAADDLDERARVIALIEKHSSEERPSGTVMTDLEAHWTPSSNPVATSSPPVARPAPSTETMTVVDGGMHERRKRPVLWVALGLVLLGGLGTLAFVLRDGTSQTRADGVVRQEPASDVSSRPASAATTPSTHESAVDQPSSDSDSEASAADPEGSDDTLGEPSEVEPAPAGEAKPPPPQVNLKPKPQRLPARAACAEPTYIDEKGIRRFKVECL